MPRCTDPLRVLSHYNSTDFPHRSGAREPQAARCRVAGLLVAAFSLSTACSEPAESQTEMSAQPPQQATASALASIAGASSTLATSASVPQVIVNPPTPPSPSEPTTNSCVSTERDSSLQPAVLTFAFDVSGSMGKGDKPYHDKALKWDPVVAATTRFFASETAAGVRASLTFFPIDDEDGRCDGDSYAAPDVPLTELPSTAFAEAIAAITPESEDDWRGGTPTMAVLEGMLQFIADQREQEPDARYAMVLVTDGAPQDCSDEEDDIAAVADVVRAVAADIPTYVIGVQNPVTDEEPDPPDVVSNLDLIAEAGGTESATLIDTGNPGDTAAAIELAIGEIRAQALSCDVSIPAPPPEQTFDRDRVNVSVTLDATRAPLVYSEACSDGSGWHYDDPAAPTIVRLCPTICQAVQAAASVNIAVEFGCATRVPMVL